MNTILLWTEGWSSRHMNATEHLTPRAISILTNLIELKPEARLTAQVHKYYFSTCFSSFLRP